MLKQFIPETNQVQATIKTEFDLFKMQSISHPLFQTVIDGVAGMSLLAFFLASCAFTSDMLKYNFVALPFVFKLIAGQVYLAYSKSDDLSSDLKLSIHLFVARTITDAAFLFLFAGLTIGRLLPLVPFFVYMIYMIIEILVSAINVNLLHDKVFPAKNISESEDTEAASVPNLRYVGVDIIEESAEKETCLLEEDSSLLEGLEGVSIEKLFKDSVSSERSILSVSTAFSRSNSVYQK
jgi:hypothetical protein